ncbi:uncharacterized protein [Rutidosis leptorrhynchoides]|uniref:uncharacterized protein n=1 Tax=Rutidosis leptorrhynchoides TaxID=125765 RepID=UPI003A99874F
MGEGEDFDVDIELDKLLKVVTDKEYIKEEIPGEDEPFEEITDGAYIDSFGVSFSNSFVKELGDWKKTLFWDENWTGSGSLKDRFNRLYRLESNKQALISDRIKRDGSNFIGNWCWSRTVSGRTGAELSALDRLIESCRLESDRPDRWVWNLSSNGSFTSKTMTSIIEEKLLPRGTHLFETLRNYLVPKKVEVFIWRSRKKRLATLVELDKRGIDLHSVRCPLCDDDVESVDHALIFCKHAFEVWRRVFDWWGVSMGSSLSIMEMFHAHSNITMSDIGFKIWQAVIWTCGYLIWWNRNQMTFHKKCWSPPVALCEVQVKTFEWISKRCKKKDLVWHEWLHNPQNLIL